MEKKTILLFGAPAVPLKERLEGCFDIEWVAAADQASLDERARRAEVLLVFSPHLGPEVLSQLPRLQWVQSLSSGVDNLQSLLCDLPRVLLTSAKGIHGPQMAEMAILHMLTLARDVPRLVRNQMNAKWERWAQPLLWRKTVAIVGVGTIGRELAQRCKAFGMKTIGVVTKLRAEAGFDQILGRSELHQALSQADFTVLLTPFDSTTHRFFNADVIMKMKQGAFLVNLARGEVLDATAALQAVRSGRLAGIGLDVFDKEPLEQGSELWSTPGVFITPHVGGMSDIYDEQLMPLLVHNIGRYLAGDLRGMRNHVESATCPA